MIAEIFTFLASPVLGGAIGGILGYMNRKHDVELKRIDVQLERDKMANSLAMRQADLQQIQAEAEGKRGVAVIEADATIESAIAAARARAQEADSINAAELKAAGGFGRFLLVLVMVLQKIIRPGATILLLGTATWLNSELILMLRGQGWAELPIADRLALGRDAIQWTFTQTTMALGYWFVARGTGK